MRGSYAIEKFAVVVTRQVNDVFVVETSFLQWNLPENREGYDFVILIDICNYVWSILYSPKKFSSGGEDVLFISNVV